MTTKKPDPIPQAAAPFYLTFLWVCNLLWTLIMLGLNIAEFLQKGQWIYQGPGSLIYFATLAAYAGVKETHQWAQGESQAQSKGRKGVIFVGVWVFFSMGAILTVNLGQGYVFPHELLTITLEVLGIFFGTQASRALRRGRVSAPRGDEVEEKVLQLIKQMGGASRADLAGRLGYTKGEAQYALQKLVKSGAVKKVASKKYDPDTKYVAL